MSRKVDEIKMGILCRFMTAQTRSQRLIHVAGRIRNVPQAVAGHSPETGSIRD